MSTNQRSRPDSALIYVINMEFLDHNGFFCLTNVPRWRFKSGSGRFQGGVTEKHLYACQLVPVLRG